MTAPTAGGAVHAGLAVRNRGNLTAPPDPTTLAAISQAVHAHWADAQAAPSPDEWRTPARCLELLDAHWQAFPSEPWTAEAVELPFCFPLGRTTVQGKPYNILYQGRIDLLARWQGRLWAVDFKTTTRLEASFWSDWELSQGQLGYSWAVPQLTGEPCAGTVIRALHWRKPAGASAKLPRNAFDQRIFTYDQERLEEWRLNTLAAAHDILTCNARGYWVQARSNCVGRYGLCQYHPVCTLPAAMRGALLDGPQYTRYIPSNTNEKATE